MHSCDLRADKSILAQDGVCPANCVANDRLNGFVIEDREGFVARLEIEEPAVAAVEGTARAEDLAALVPAHKHDLVGLGDTKRLGIGFDAVELKISVDALCDGVCGVDNPNTLKVAVLTPRKVAGRAHERLEYLRMVCRMEADYAHTHKNRGLYAGDDLIGNVPMSDVTPPDEHVGVVDDLLRQSAFRLVNSRGADLDVVAFQEVGDRLMNAVRVDLGNALVMPFVMIFVPNRYSHFLISERKLFLQKSFSLTLSFKKISKINIIIITFFALQSA